MQCFRSKEAQEQVYNYLVNVLLPYGNVNALRKIKRNQLLKRPLVTVRNDFQNLMCRVSITQVSMPFSTERLTRRCPEDKLLSDFIKEMNGKFDFKGSSDHKKFVVMLSTEQAKRVVKMLDLYLL